ncbi:MAG: DUF2279 domain-containing protein [Salibacteraceae bacterium]
MVRILFFIGFLFVSVLAYCQDNVHWTSTPDSLSKKRLTLVSTTALSAATLTFVGLNELWYKDYPKSSFHTFNDWGEWEGVDKVGHGFSSYYAGVVGYHSMRWTGLSENKSLVFGATWGLVWLTSIEILDGFNEQWGFSWGDMTANAIGSGLFIGQQLAWGEQRILPKFSYHTTEFASVRPNLLGSSFTEQLFKDYNGQTYWLSTNIHSFLSNSSKFPKWVSVSVGYGATGMIGGNSNPKYDDGGYVYPTYDRYSQFYLSLDLDLQRIKTKSRFLNSVLVGLSWIKIPFPTLEFNKNGVVFHPIYF